MVGRYYYFVNCLKYPGEKDILFSLCLMISDCELL